MPSHLKRERIVHDLAEDEKHCAECDEDLCYIGEEVSERYEHIPAQLLVLEDACQKYACACTVKTAAKPTQPIEKSTAGASLLAHVIVSKIADHLPVRKCAIRRHTTAQRPAKPALKCIILRGNDPGHSFTRGGQISIAFFALCIGRLDAKRKAPEIQLQHASRELMQL